MTDIAQPRREVDGPAASRPRLPLSGLICKLAGHRASPETIRNGENHFSRCTRCAIDLVRIDGSWSAPPAGFRIIWRGAPPKDAEAEQACVALLPTPPVIVAAPAAVEWPLAAGAPVERRQRVERRKSESADLPTFLNGRDRRRSRDRRAGFGKRLVVRP